MSTEEKAIVTDNELGVLFAVLCKVVAGDKAWDYDDWGQTPYTVEEASRLQARLSSRPDAASLSVEDLWLLYAVLLEVVSGFDSWDDAEFAGFSYTGRDAGALRQRLYAKLQDLSRT